MSTVWRSLGALLFVALCMGQARAQVGGIDSDPGDPGTGGRNTLRGNIYYANGRRADKRVKVKLRSPYGEQFTMSDDSGSFSFRRLRGGSYTVLVDAGSEFELASDTVDFIEGTRRRDDPGQTQTVQITLYARQAAARPVGTVDVASAAVPEEARNLYKDALDSAQAGESKKAIEQLNAAIKIYPGFMSALNELGVQHMRLKQYDRSENAFQEALKIAPQAFTPHLNYGILLMMKKDFVKAATQLQRAAQIDGSSAAAHLNLGKAFVNLAIYNKAEKELQQAIGIGGEESIEAHRYLAMAYIEMGESVRAVSALEKYLSLSPKAKDADKIREIIKQLRSQAKN
ncbi:MAG: tetratricopeptide repeat protein [Blastocatellia bacterium]